MEPAHIDLELLSYLQSFLTENKRDLFEKSLQQRTRHIAMVIENVIDEHNTNAVIRSCECFGIQDAYVISGGKGFKPAKRVLRGSGKWSNIYRYNELSGNNALKCMTDLKEKGYKIIVTSPHENKTTISKLNLDRPVAICFGHEKTGISETLIARADESVSIPMTGFTESLNISVAAGIVLYELTKRLYDSEIDFHLSEKEKNELRYHWTLKCLNKPELLIKNFYEKKITAPQTTH